MPQHSMGRVLPLTSPAPYVRAILLLLLHRLQEELERKRQEEFNKKKKAIFANLLSGDDAGTASSSTGYGLNADPVCLVNTHTHIQSCSPRNHTHRLFGGTSPKKAAKSKRGSALPNKASFPRSTNHHLVPQNQALEAAACSATMTTMGLPSGVLVAAMTAAAACLVAAAAGRQLRLCVLVPARGCLEVSWHL